MFIIYNEVYSEFDADVNANMYRVSNYFSNQLLFLELT